MREAGRIRIGGQTSFSAARITEPFEYAVEQGFDAFEWFPDKRPTGQGWLESDLRADARALIRQTAREHDIALSVHGSLDASPLTPEGGKRLASQAEFAADLGAAIFVIHLDGGTDLVRYVEATSPLVAQLAAGGTRLAIENTPMTGPGEFNALFRHLRKGGTQSKGTPMCAAAAGMCLDVGHANVYAGTRNDYLAYVDSLSPDVVISHVHLHENWGDADSHLPLFTGPAGRDAGGVTALVERLVRRRFTGSIILEQWPDPPALLNVARARLAGLFAARRLAGATSAGRPPL